jgi:hypothetical protein
MAKQGNIFFTKNITFGKKNMFPGLALQQHSQRKPIQETLKISATFYFVYRKPEIKQ